MTSPNPTGNSFVRKMSKQSRPVALVASASLVLGFGLFSGDAARATSETEASCNVGNTVTATGTSAANTTAIQNKITDGTPLICLSGDFILNATLVMPDISVSLQDTLHLYGIGATSLKYTSGSIITPTLVNGDPLSPPELTVENLTFQEAGDIAISGYGVTVKNSTFLNNLAGAVYGSPVTVIDSVFEDNNDTFGEGAAISSGGNIEVIRSVFVNNSAEFGGAIGSSGTVTVDSSTFDGNTATSSIVDGGGAIKAPVVEVTNSTFVGNSSGFQGGAISAESGFVRFSTFLENNVPDYDLGQSIIWNGQAEPLSLGGNIFASANNPQGQVRVNGQALLTNLGGNVFSTPQSTETAIDAGSNLYQKSVSSLFGAGWVLTRNSNGTYSIPLIAGSPALGVVPAGIVGLSDVATDQRGVARVYPADAGSYELAASPNPDVLPNTGTSQAGVLSLGAAILLATGAAFIAVRARMRRRG